MKFLENYIKFKENIIRFKEIPVLNGKNFY